MSMVMPPSFHQVPVADIVCHDSPFVYTYRPEMQALQHSVMRVGVLTPLHLRQIPGAHGYHVVCGAKRFQACQQAGLTTLPALVYDSESLSDAQAFLLAVYDNVGCRPLNAVEKGRILRGLRDTFGYAVGVLVTEFCPLLDLPPHAETITAYSTLAGLDEALQASLVDGALPLETVLWIAQHPVDDRQALHTLFTSLKLGSNRAREVAVSIEEICLRDGMGAAELLRALRLPDILAEPVSGPQKIERVRRMLHEARYPHLSAHEQRFHEALQRLRLPAQVSLRPPAYFEGQHCQVTFGFRTPQELQHYAQRLLDAATGPDVDDLLLLL